MQTAYVRSFFGNEERKEQGKNARQQHLIAMKYIKNAHGCRSAEIDGKKRAFIFGVERLNWKLP